MKWIIIILLTIYEAAFASFDTLSLKEMQWSFDGITGKFDYASIQRGFKVYKEVCSACHSIRLVAFRNLESIGFSEEQVKSLASEYDILDGPNDEGQMYKRPGKLSDNIPGPYLNDKEARAANNGALPPDLSLIIKARTSGPNYVYSLITGYTNAPHDITLNENMYYNPYFAGGQIAMQPPLIDGQVVFDDGTESTLHQMAYDVVNFLQWAAEPEMQERKSLGLRVLVFISIMILLSWLANKAIWKELKNQKNE